MRRARHWAMLVSVVVASWAASAWADTKSEDKSADAAKPALGSQVDDFTFKDIRYLPRKLSELGERKAYVVAFTTLDCPVVGRYIPRLVELEKEYRDRGVQFVALNVGPNDAIVDIADQAIRTGAAFPFGKDFDGVVANALGATRTPEVIVLDGSRHIRYRGRVDSQYRLGGVKPDAGRADLREAIEDVLADRDVAVAETAVDGCQITEAKVSKPATPVTFAEHIAPIVQKHCQDCHRPQGTAPFELLTYEDTAAQADMIAEVVREQRMPPMFAASEQHGNFSNLLKLTPEERTLVAQWVDGGSQQGDMSKAPKPREFVAAEWQIGQPDLVLHIPKEESVPPDGYLAYRYKTLHKNKFIFPYTFPHDTWIKMAQIKPGNPEIVHHCNMAYIDPKGKYTDAQFITGYVPGGMPLVVDDDMGFKIPKGAVLVLQIHYVTTGEPAQDLTTVGFKFCDGLVKKELRHFRCHNGKFAIPPGDGHHEVAAQRTLDCDAVGVGMFSHMHLRGKDMTFTAIYPDGKRQTLLSVPNYNFDWQMGYVFDKDQFKFPKGTVIDCVAHFDNSTFNPYNPDAKATVREGDQTYEEMMYGFFFYSDANEDLNLTVDGKTGKAIEANETAKANSAAAD